MREIFTSGSVGGAPGNRCFYLEEGPRTSAPDSRRYTACDAVLTVGKLATVSLDYHESDRYSSND